MIFLQSSLLILNTWLTQQETHEHAELFYTLTGYSGTPFQLLVQTRNRNRIKLNLIKTNLIQRLEPATSRVAVWYVDLLATKSLTGNVLSGIAPVLEEQRLARPRLPNY